MVPQLSNSVYDNVKAMAIHTIAPVELCQQQWVRRWLMRRHPITVPVELSCSVDLGFDAVLGGGGSSKFI